MINGASAHTLDTHGLRGSAVRACPKCALRFTFVLVFFLFVFMPNDAFADDWTRVLYSSSVNDSTQWIVGASNKYDAAAYICGKTSAEVSQWSLEQRHKLSTQGGSFQWLAENLTKAWPGWNEDTLSDSLEDVFGSSTWIKMTEVYSVSPNGGVGFNPDALDTFEVNYWSETCTNDIFAGDFASSVIQNARSDLDTILNGGTLGGGYGGLQEDGNYYVFYGDPKWYSGSAYGDTSRSYWLWDLTNNGKYTCATGTVSAQYPAIPSGLRILLPKSMFSEQLLSRFDPATYTYAVTFYKQSNWTSSPDPVCQLSLYIFETSNIQFNETSNEPYSDSSYLSTSVDGDSCKGTYITETGTFSYSYQSNTITVASNHVYSHTTTIYDYLPGSSSLPASSTGLSNMLMVSKSVGSSGGGGDEPNPWPTPVPPEQPNVPEPPVVSPPPITGPDLPTDPPQDPTITPEPEPTGTDYTVYLKAIIRQLNQVMVQMSNHCKHIRDQISTSANAIISNMHTFIGDLQESIDSNFAALNDYLEDLTTWYENFMQDLIDGILDEFSTVESILRQILRKIGVPRGTPREVEKDVDDGFDFLEWLINFITSKLAGVIDEFVGDVGGLINGIKDKFPFSIPWDIMGMLALLDGVRATPRFEITLPAVTGWWQQTTFVIDLSPFDSVASAVRIMINAWWLLVLAMKTNWMLMIMGDSTSLGERIANRISGGGE